MEVVCNSAAPTLPQSGLAAFALPLGVEAGFDEAADGFGQVRYVGLLTAPVVHPVSP